MSAHFRLFLNALLIFASGALFAGEVAQIVFSAGEARVAGRLARVGETVERR